MRVSKAMEEHQMALIRQLLIINPKASLRKLQEGLDSNDVHIEDLHYLGKLREKVIRERTKRLDHAVMSLDWAEHEDRAGKAMEDAWRVAHSNAAPPMTKLVAYKIIADISHKLFNQKLILGLYDKAEKIAEEKAKKDWRPDPELVEIVQAFKNQLASPRQGVVYDGYAPLPANDPKESKPDLEILKSGPGIKPITTTPRDDDRSFVLPPKRLTTTPDDDDRSFVAPPPQ